VGAERRQEGQRGWAYSRDPDLEQRAMQRGDLHGVGPVPAGEAAEVSAQAVFAPLLADDAFHGLPRRFGNVLAVAVGFAGDPQTVPEEVDAIGEPVEVELTLDLRDLEAAPFDHRATDRFAGGLGPPVDARP